MKSFASLALLSLAAPSALGQNQYTGAGLVLEVTIDGLQPGDVEQIEVGQMAEFGAEPDLALRLADGRVFMNPDTWRYGGYKDLSDGVNMLTMTQSGADGEEFLLLSDGTDLMRARWDDFDDPQLNNLGAGLGGDLVVSSEVDLASASTRVAMVDSNGTRLRVIDVTPISATLVHTILATTAQGSFHDVRFVNISSTSTRADQLGVITDAGLEFLEQDGTAALYGGQPHFIAASPVDAHLGVLPGSGTGTGRDYLLWHVNHATLGAVVLVLNDGHSELIGAAGMGLKQLHVADWLGGDGNDSADLLLPMNDLPMVWVSNNDAPTSNSSAIFSFSTTYVNLIDMGKLEKPGAPLPYLAAPLFGSADLDRDGSMDVVMLDARNRLCLLPGEHPNAETNRVEGRLLKDNSAEPGEHTVRLSSPTLDTYRAEYTVWIADTLEAELDAVPIAEGEIFFPSTINTEANGQFDWVAPAGSVSDPVFHVQIAPFKSNGEAMPVSGFQWQADPGLTPNVVAEAESNYPWYAAAQVPLLNGNLFADTSVGGLNGDDGPNGTTPGPKPPAEPVRCVPSRETRTGFLCCPGDPLCPQ